jgi:PKD repeat protein
VSNGLPDAAITAIAVAPEDPLHVYVSLSGYQAGQKVFESTDGGASWTNISRNLPNVPANTIVRQSGAAEGLYVGTDIGVFYSDNTLGNWQPFSDGLPRVVVTELEVHEGAGKLRASTYGRGLWQSELWIPVDAPPTAVIGHDALTICAGDAITFTDLSLNAAPGSVWSFPGGSPATSTDAAPQVTYPNSGTYTVTLTVSNAFGTDDATMNIPVQVLPNRLDIAITLDDYPGESSWAVVDAAGADVLTGGPYTGLGAGSTVNAHACLAEGCYTFVMFDSYGDGICCSAGNGSFSVTNPQLGTIASGGEFTYTDATPFCVELSTAVPRTDLNPNLDARPVNGAGAYELLLSGANPVGALEVRDALGRTVRLLRWSSDRLFVDLGAEAAGLYTLVQGTDRGLARIRLLRP